jgi:hypothetical protein
MNILCALAILHVYPDFTDNNLICSTVRPYGKVIPPGCLLNNRMHVPSCYNFLGRSSHKEIVIFTTALTRKAYNECFHLMEFTKKRKELCIFIINLYLLCLIRRYRELGCKEGGKIIGIIELHFSSIFQINSSSKIFHASIWIPSRITAIKVAISFTTQSFSIPIKVSDLCTYM